MSDQTTTQEEMGPTKPLAEHEWLKNLEGSWRTESQMWMDPSQEPSKSEGKEKVTVLGGLWAFTEGEGAFPGGETMYYKSGLGYDVSFKEYRGFWIASMSSHLWRYHCVLSDDKKTMTMNCEGPDMEKEGETANYKDVIEIHSADHRSMTSYGQDKASGEWVKFVECHYYRV